MDGQRKPNISIARYISLQLRDQPIHQQQSVRRKAANVSEVNGHSKNLSTDQVLPGRFLDVESLCELLKNETVTVSTIPKGVKEHVYFVVSNGKNIAKRNRGEKSNFEGDCGVWLSKASSTKKNYFIV